jgi:16S rRNA (uracil1498-N3)-methyltransferase
MGAILDPGMALAKSSFIRLLVAAPLEVGAGVVVSPGQAHYLGGVMRRGPGDEILVFNGRDGEFLARIESLRRDRGELAVLEKTRAQAAGVQAAGADLWLAFAPLKRDATDLLVQKATELGVAALLPVFTERTNAARVNPDRLLAIATEAAEQSERLTVPRLDPACRLPELLARWPGERRLVVAVERAAAPPVAPAMGPAALLVGPEGGFTPAELDAMGKHPFVQPATLGSLILRAETAAIVGLALLQARSGG